MPVINPATIALAKRFWKPALGAVVAIGAVWAFTAWKNDLVADADAAGFERARSAYQFQVEQANERERLTQGRLDQMNIAFGALGSQREQAINLTVKPQIERIQNEVATDPRYRSCLVSQRVLDDLQAGRASVDAGIASSNPRAARPGS